MQDNKPPGRSSDSEDQRSPSADAHSSQPSLDEDLNDLDKVAGKTLYRFLGCLIGARWAKRVVLLFCIPLAIYAACREFGIALTDIVNESSSIWSEYAPLPSADPRYFTIAIVPFENDPNHNIEDVVFEDLKDLERTEGIQVQKYDRPAISDDVLEKGTAAAQRYLKQSGAQVLLWGKVLTGRGNEVPKLYWSVSQANFPVNPGRYPLGEDLSLPPTFLSDLANVLHLVALTQSSVFHSSQTSSVQQFEPYLDRVRHLLNSDRNGWTNDETAQVHIALAGALIDSASAESNAKPLLEEAAHNYRLALEELPRPLGALTPLSLYRTQYWILTQINLGVTLLHLGNFEANSDSYKAAVDAFQSALSQFTHDTMPYLWVYGQVGLGAALVTLDTYAIGSEDARRGLNAFDAASDLVSRSSAPLLWADIQSARGAALFAISTKSWTATAHSRRWQPLRLLLSCKHETTIPQIGQKTSFQ